MSKMLFVLSVMAFYNIFLALFISVEMGKVYGQSQEYSLSDIVSNMSMRLDRMELAMKDKDKKIEQLEYRLKRVAPTTPNAVAFRAYMTATTAYAKRQVVIYNHETLDIGNGYNPRDGLYFVPSTGTYVITWITVPNYNDYVQTLLVVNGAVVGSSFSDSEEIHDIHQSTGIVVLNLSKGDHLFIRVGSTKHGVIQSDDPRSKSAIAGWKLF
ncbi:uncharacterized protein LOC110447829 [Mizuhopecten yessoensis]|uniref:Elastin microfibril interfacer 2 n=1 Tax=Mizuhopecten yessoensis TaxID=6573 RepID=A0A210QUI3_MIZYE|nr:uncharacterized protein LOC110447829 [Mizuhopecten yessoensis]OWF52395.1 Elastin microfibril interfacer 2 [Mizuhopecten yessoensis]